MQKLLTGSALAAALAASILITHPSLASDSDGKVDPQPKPVVRDRLAVDPSFDVQVGMDGELFPAFANYLSMQPANDREFGIVSVTVHNPTSQTIDARIGAQIKGWTDEEIQIAKVPAGGTRKLTFAPTLLPRVFNNREIVAATTLVMVSDMRGRQLYSSTAPIRIRSAQDMFWGKQFKYAPFIASWVTPHDVQVEKVLSQAKNYMPGRRLPGYEPWKDESEQEQSTYLQARAIYRTLQKKGVSYVKSSLTLGANTSVSQRIRSPRETLDMNSGNCIDNVVMFASLLENLQLDPVVVVVPGHAYVGVRSSQNGAKFLFIDIALVGRMNFEQAVKSADAGLEKQAPEKILRIAVSESRRAGIYPMPQW